MKFDNLVKVNLYLADKVEEGDIYADIDGYVVKIYPTSDGTKWLIASGETLDYGKVYATS